MYSLNSALGPIYGDGLQSLYEEDREPTPELPESCELIGAPAFADIFRRANVGEDLRDLEDAFYRLEDSGNALWEAMLAYVKARPSEFFTDA